MLQLEDILKATGGKVIKNGPVTFRAVSIDSRTITDGDIFLALKGQRFDGHDFLSESLMKGSGAIIENYEKFGFLEDIPHRTVVLVDNTTRALREIAIFLRRHVKKIVAITGSNGKTTTKELLWSVLSRRSLSIKNPGNLNNEIGLPLSIINGVSLKGDVDYGVYEMGASRRGDIRLLCEIARPDYGVITNIGHAHLEGMGGIEGVLRTKTEMAEFVDVLFINGDDAYLKAFKPPKGLNIIKFGLSENCSVRARDINWGSTYSIYTISAQIETKSSRRLELKESIRLRIPGKGNIYNSLAAATVALYLDIPIEEIQEALQEFEGVKMRLELREINNVCYIIDSYNANPDSMKNAITELISRKDKRTIAVLGDMLELGDYSESFHRELGRFLYENGIDLFIAVGTQMKNAFEEFTILKNGRYAFSAEDPDEAGKILKDLVEPGDTVLIKGSRMMAMEKVLKELEYAG